MSERHHVLLNEISMLILQSILMYHDSFESKRNMSDFAIAKSSAYATNLTYDQSEKWRNYISFGCTPVHIISNHITDDFRDYYS